MQRKIPQIPVNIHLVNVIIPLATQAEAVRNMLSVHNDGWLIWTLPPPQTDSASWIRRLEMMVEKNITNHRLEHIKRIVFMVNPLDSLQARALHNIAPHAHIIYIGPDIKKPTTDVRLRMIMNATKELAARGHQFKAYDPATQVDILARQILTEPVHTLTDTQSVAAVVRTFPPQTVSYLTPALA